MSFVKVLYAPSRSLLLIIFIHFLRIADAQSTDHGFNVTSFTNSTSSTSSVTSSSSSDSNSRSRSSLVSSTSETESRLFSSSVVSSSLISHIANSDSYVSKSSGLGLTNTIVSSPSFNSNNIRTGATSSFAPTIISTSNTPSRMHNSSNTNTIDLKPTASSNSHTSSDFITNAAKSNSAPFSDAASNSYDNKTRTERNSISFSGIHSTPSPNNTESQPDLSFTPGNKSTKSRLNTPPIPHITPAPTFNHTGYHHSDHFGDHRGNFSGTSFSVDALYQNQNPYNTTVFPYNIYPPNPSLESRCGSSWLSKKSYFPVIPPAASPCCLNCTLFGGDVQVFVWPTPRPTPLVNTVYDEFGYTFISPSVYVAFNQLSATNLCGALGQTYYSTTLAFASNGLFTSIAPVIDNNKAPAALKNRIGEYSWTNFEPNDLLGNCTSITSNSGAVTFSYNPCSPMLSVPFSVFQIDNSWTTCLPGISAFYDPPRILTPANGLGGDPPVTIAPKITPTHEPAKAGSVPAPMIAHPTDPPQKSFQHSFELSADSPTASPVPTSGQEPVQPVPSAKYPPPPSAQQPAPGQNSASGLQPDSNTEPDPLQQPEHGSSDGQPASRPPANEPSGQKPTSPQPSLNQQLPSEGSKSPQQNPSVHDPESQHSQEPQSNPVPSVSESGQTPQNRPGSKLPLPNEESPNNSINPDGSKPGPVNTPGHDFAEPQGSRLNPGAGENYNTPYEPQAITIPLVSEGNGAGLHATQLAANHINAPQLADHGIKVVPNAPLPTIGNLPASVDSSGNVIINSQTITPNAPPVTINSTPIALGDAGLVIGGPTTVAINRPRITPAIVGGSPASVDSSGNVVINDQVITPNAPPVVINNTPVHLGTVGLVVGSSAPVSVNNSPHHTLAVIGGSPASVDSSGNIVVDDQIITPNAPPVTINYTPVQLNTAGLVIGDAPPVVVNKDFPGTPLATIGGSPISIDRSRNIKVGDQVIRPGVPITINNTPVLLGTGGLVYGGPSTVPVDQSPLYLVGSQQLKPSGKPVVNSGTTYSLAPHATAVVINAASPISIPTDNPLPVITIDSSAIKPNSKSNYILAGQTLAPDGPPLIIAGTTYSLAPKVKAIVVNGVTTSISVPSPIPVLTIGSSLITANSKSEYVIVSQTLVPAGTPITLSDTTFSLAPKGSAIIVNGITSALFALFSPAVLTIGSSTISANSNSQFVIAGQTLTPGANAITIPGKTIPGTTISGKPIPGMTVPAATISLGTSARFVVVNGITSTVAAASPANTKAVITATAIDQGLGAIIAGGFGVTNAPNLDNPSSSVFTIKGQVFTAASSAFSIAGTIISAGGPGVIISGTLISLEPSGTLHIGTSTIVLSSSSPSFTVGDDQTFTPSPSIDGTTISAVTVSGTRGSLTSQFPLPPTSTNEQQGFAGLGFFDAGARGRGDGRLGLEMGIAVVVVLVGVALM